MVRTIAALEAVSKLWAVVCALNDTCSRTGLSLIDFANSDPADPTSPSDSPVRSAKSLSSSSEVMADSFIIMSSDDFDDFWTLSATFGMLFNAAPDFFNADVVFSTTVSCVKASTRVLRANKAVAKVPLALSTKESAAMPTRSASLTFIRAEIGFAGSTFIAREVTDLSGTRSGSITTAIAACFSSFCSGSLSSVMSSSSLTAASSGTIFSSVSSASSGSALVVSVSTIGSSTSFSADATSSSAGTTTSDTAPVVEVNVSRYPPLDVTRGTAASETVAVAGTRVSRYPPLEITGGSASSTSSGSAVFVSSSTFDSSTGSSAGTSSGSSAGITASGTAPMAGVNASRYPPLDVTVSEIVAVAGAKVSRYPPLEVTGGSVSTDTSDSRYDVAPLAGPLISSSAGLFDRESRNDELNRSTRRRPREVVVKNAAGGFGATENASEMLVE
mmetsp:Transcript_15070/g.30094  ORF Transcript_15070/g.30094 Transcript_15070/m.30094 type:complete len:445 (-) Transcript_15070:104-1438(-)